MTFWRKSFLLFLISLGFALELQANRSYPWHAGQQLESLNQRIAPPAGYQRIPVSPSSFAEWLRGIPLKPGRPSVYLFNGNLKENQTAHHAVIDIDVGPQDLQQCADAIIRLRAEYLRAVGREKDICFRFTSGDKAEWAQWKEGWRPTVVGNYVKWLKRAKADQSYGNFSRYLTSTYRWAGSASLSKELMPVPDPRKPEIGDVFIEGGFPGHAVLVVDVAQDKEGKRIFLLSQSYMPAQDIHILKNPGSSMDPWYSAEGTGSLNTPEWVFSRTALKRFSEKGCP